MTSKLVAIGGGFLMEPENPLLDLYCLSCTGKTIPKVCFIPTASGELPPGIGIDDGAAVLFEGQKIVEVVASRAGANAYRVKLESGQIIEELLEAKLLA